MVSSAATTQDVSVLLEGLRAQEAALTAEHERRLAKLAEDRRSVERTIQLLTEASASAPAAPSDLSVAHEGTEAAPVPVSLASKPVSEWAQLLRGMSQRAALRRIAEENGGILRTTEAGRILVAAGLITGNPRYAGSHLYNIVMKSPHFERIAPGTFRLLAPAAPSDPPSDAGVREQS